MKILQTSLFAATLTFLPQISRSSLADTGDTDPPSPSQKHAANPRVFSPLDMLRERSTIAGSDESLSADGSNPPSQMNSQADDSLGDTAEDDTQTVSSLVFDPLRDVFEIVVKSTKTGEIKEVRRVSKMNCMDPSHPFNVLGRTTAHNLANSQNIGIKP